MNDFFFFKPFGITSSAFWPEIFRKNLFHIFFAPNRLLILHLHHAAFKIGHTLKSETFIPTIHGIPGQDGAFVIDMAGQKDSNGGIIEMLNCFINKKLLNSIDNIIILIPFTQANINNSRG